MRHALLAAVVLTTSSLFSGSALAARFSQVNLVSDVSGLALHTDSHLVNPWGLAPGASGVFWTANNGTDTSTLYDPDGTVRSLVVTIPAGEPTGVVSTAGTDSSFWIPSADTLARAIFIFVTQHGTVAAWNPNVNMTNAIQVAAVDGAQFTGAAIGGAADSPRLFAANFGAGRIEAFNRNFTLVTAAGSFVDPNLPSGYAPFNIANIDGELWVAYAQRDGSGDEVPGAGLGIVSVFDQNGVYLRRFTTAGPLNAPWAIVRAPAGFDDLGGAVLIGNFGDGRINAFDFSTGSFLGAMQDTSGNALSIEGLWGLHFGLPVSGSEVAQRLYFAAGIEDESHGLFGYLAEFTGSGPGPGPGPGGEVCDNESRSLGFWRKQCGGPSHPGGGPGSGGGGGNGHGGGGHGPGGPNPGNPHSDQGRDDDHRPAPWVSADSLDVLLGCIRTASGPNAFGTEGCFTAGCDLLTKVGRRTAQEKAAQQLLITRLNLCSGLVCDSFRVSCDLDDEEDGDLPDTLRLGDIADSLDVLLCGDGDVRAIRSLTSLLACVNGGGSDEDDDAEDDSDSRSALKQKLSVQTIGSSPARLGAATAVQFSVSAAEPSLVHLRIYDALGRLVAEPLHGSMVMGSVQVSWNGRDLQGALVTPGNYFYRASSGGATSSGRIVIIR